jgi:hypothetical protein
VVDIAQVCSLIHEYSAANYPLPGVDDSSWSIDMMSPYESFSLLSVACFLMLSGLVHGILVADAL